MNWLRDSGFHGRPLVVVEDHAYHISQLLQETQQSCPQLLNCMTIVCLDRQGPDTDQAIQEWLTNYDGVQVSASTNSKDLSSQFPASFEPLPEQVFAHQVAYCKRVAALLRPGGLLLQDIELATLSFIPSDRWWETTILASTIRGMKNELPLHCAFFSNKRGFEATFGAELLSAGHDPRDVLNKEDLKQQVVPRLMKFLQEHFPWQMDYRQAASGRPDLCSRVVLSRIPAACQEIEEHFDILLWPLRDQGYQLSGKMLPTGKKGPLRLPADSNEYQTWHDLLQTGLENQPGVEVIEVGSRVAPPGALRAEATNVAARHIHTLRGRLSDPKAIVTVQGRYQLREDLNVGIVTDRSNTKNPPFGER